jgi:hypothetical protein
MLSERERAALALRLRSFQAQFDAVSARLLPVVRQKAVGVNHAVPQRTGDRNSDD